MNHPPDDRLRWQEEVLGRVDPSHAMVVVIDIQKDFCDPAGALARAGGDITPCRVAAERIRTFIPLVRTYHPEIAFFRLSYSPELLTLSQRERLLRNGSPIICDPAGTGTDLFLLEPGPSDHVFVKHRYSAFSCERFTDYLAHRRLDTIVVVGVDTHICVESTVRQGFDLGYRMIVLEDLVATRSSAASSHAHSLAIIKRYFGLVLPSHELLQRWETAARPAAPTRHRRSQTAL